MTTHDELFAGASLPVLFQMHGETVIYRPKGGRPRRVTAIVKRRQEAPIRETGTDMAPRTIVKAMNDPHLGISSRDLDTGGDEIDVALRKGGPLERRSIVDLVSDDGGRTCVEVQ